MIKFRDIGAYKAAQNIPYCTTSVVLHNGMGVTVDFAAKTVALPNATTAKEDVFLVMNRYDKPEVNSPNEYVINPGEYPRLFRVKSLDGYILDLDMDQVTGEYSSIAVGDKLGFGTDGKMVEVSDVADCLTYFEVIEKTTFNGQGLAVRVIAQAPTTTSPGVGG